MVEEFLAVLTDITHLALIVSIYISQFTDIETLIDNNARIRKACKSLLDSPLSTAPEAIVR